MFSALPSRADIARRSRHVRLVPLAEVAHLSLHRRALGCAIVIRAARLAAISAMAGRPEQAHKAVARLRQLNPALRVSTLKDVVGPYRRAEDISRLEEGLRQAGLPE